MTAAMVLCAGLGTRLAPLTSVMPKALMPIGDRPAVAHVLSGLRAAGIDRAVLNSHHLSDVLSRSVTCLDAAVEVVHEHALLGTAGGLRNAAQAIGAGAVLVWNGDIYAPDLAIAELLSRFAAGDAGWLWSVAPMPAGQGTVGLDERGDVVRLRGEVFGVERRGGDFVGVSVMGPSVRETLPVTGCLVGDVALPRLRAGARIATMTSEARFIDVGEPRALLRANLAWLAARGLRSWCGDRARVGPHVTLDAAVVGAGARVMGQGALQRTVVFPGAEIAAPGAGLLVASGAQAEVSHELDDAGIAGA